MKQLDAFIQARTTPSLPATPSQFAPHQIITLNDISALLDKQTSFWVSATLSITNFNQTFWYMSCPVCYKYTDVDYKEDFNCYCGADVVGKPRCRAYLEVKDNWTSHPAIVFGETAELLFAQNAKYVMEKSIEVVNHGIDPIVMSKAIAAASDFFKLPTKEKREFMSNDVNKPVRYGTSLKDGVDRVQYWRVFLKHYAHPLEEWIASWPKNPPKYRENMGRLSSEVRRVAIEVLGAITESLGLGPKYLHEEFEHGMQVIAVNCYPPCPHPDLALGLPPHSDYTCITTLLQSHPGLEVMDMKDGTWRAVQESAQGAFQVHIGDHMEVLSNGLYKSLVHRATLNSETTRISIASLQSLGVDVKIGSAAELVDEEHQKRYKETSFREFLKFLSTNDMSEGTSYIDTLRIKE